MHDHEHPVEKSCSLNIIEQQIVIKWANLFCYHFSLNFYPNLMQNMTI